MNPAQILPLTHVQKEHVRKYTHHGLASGCSRRPVIDCTGRLPDGRYYGLQAGWCPYQGVDYARLSVHGELDVDLTISGRDVDAVLDFARNLGAENGGGNV